MIANVLYRLRKALELHRLRVAEAVARKERPDIFLEIDEIIAIYQENGGLRHPYQAYKLYELAEILKREDPRHILELGTGTTTAVLAAHTRRVPDATLHCVDESEHWLQNALQIAAVAQAEKSVTWTVAERIRTQSAAKEFVNYNVDLEAQGPFDFVLIDGPSLNFGGVKRKSAINGDILRILEASRPKTILVDIRSSTVEYLRRVLADYDAAVSDVISQRIRPGFMYFSTFRLKESLEDGGTASSSDRTSAGSSSGMAADLLP